MYDIIIIGYGPAGCTAGIFAQRRGMKTLILGDMGSLTQVEEATVIDDWPGESDIKGVDLMEKFRDHVKKLKIELKEERAIGAKKSGKGFSVKTDKKEYQTRTLIIATGSKHRKGMIKGEDKFSGRGVSYCATCDAPLFKGKKTAVIGGGDSAVTYALLLQDVGSQATLIHRRDQLRAAEVWQKRILKSKVNIIWDSVVNEIKGDQTVKSIVVMNKKTKEKKEIPMDGVFIAIGTIPTSEIAKNIGVKLNEWGFIEVDKEQKTNVKGVFAAGDCCDNPSKKIVTAAGDGAIAADSAYDYLKKE
jgi:thioredoxin reductase (NADPH)